jgi:hypothetical protein
MGTDFSIRPVGAPVATPIAPPVSEAANSSVATELPASQSVTVVDAGTAARNESNAVNVSISHQVIVDQAAASIVYQVVDTKTDTVVTQFPDEAVLRRRAYFRALDLTKDASTRVLATDRRA